MVTPRTASATKRRSAPPPAAKALHARAAKLRTRRVARPARGMSTPAMIGWGALALVGIVVAVGFAAFLLDELPIDERQVRRLGAQAKSLARSGAAADALGTFKDFLSELAKRL